MLSCTWRNFSMFWKVAHTVGQCQCVRRHLLSETLDDVVCHVTLHPEEVMSKWRNVYVIISQGSWLHQRLRTSSEPLQPVGLRHLKLLTVYIQYTVRQKMSFVKTDFSNFIFRTRKPCCRKETARCRSCSFQLKVCPTFTTSLRVASKATQASEDPSIPKQNRI